MIPDGWSKSGAVKVAKQILGPAARVTVAEGKCVLYLARPGGRVFVGAADLWEGLIRQVFVEPFRPKEGAPGY